MRHCIGIADEAFIRGEIPMTKQEVRILTLTKARIQPEDCILDIGAGTGSLSVEAALLAPEGKVYAVERKKEGVDLIRKNAAKFQAANLTAVAGEAPDALKGMPWCDVILIGGSGRCLEGILTEADALLNPGGRLVVNCITIETLYETLQWMKPRENYASDVVQVQVTRLNQVGAYHMAQALNPIYIMTYTKH